MWRYNLGSELAVGSWWKLSDSNSQREVRNLKMEWRCLFFSQKAPLHSLSEEEIFFCLYCQSFLFSFTMSFVSWFLSGWPYLLNTRQKTLRSHDNLHIQFNVKAIVWKFNDVLAWSLKKKVHIHLGDWMLVIDYATVEPKRYTKKRKLKCC